MVRVETIKKCFCWSTYWPAAHPVATADVLWAQVTVQCIPIPGHQLKPLQLSRQLQRAGGVSKKTEGTTGNIWGSERSPHVPRDPRPFPVPCSCASTMPRTPLGLAQHQLSCRAWTRPSPSCYLEASNWTLPLNSLLLTGKHACIQKKKGELMWRGKRINSPCTVVFWVTCLLLGIRAGFPQDSSQQGKLPKGEEGETNEKLCCSTQVNNISTIKKTLSSRLTPRHPPTRSRASGTDGRGDTKLSSNAGWEKSTLLRHPLLTTSTRIRTY